MGTLVTASQRAAKITSCCLASLGRLAAGNEIKNINLSIFLLLPSGQGGHLGSYLLSISGWVIQHLDSLLQSRFTTYDGISPDLEEMEGTRDCGHEVVGLKRLTALPCVYTLTTLVLEVL